MQINIASRRRTSVGELLPRQFFNATLRDLVMAFTLVALLSGCENAQRELTTAERMQAVQLRQETKPDFYVPRKSVDYMADLNAIRENKNQDKSQISDIPNKVITPSSAANLALNAGSAAQGTRPIAEAPSPVSPTPTSSNAVPAGVYTNKDAATLPPPAIQDKATPPLVATTIDTSTPVANEANQVRVIANVRPNFPREATQRGIQRGNVRARATINAAGDVTDVTIVAATPVGIFNREVISSMQRWKFNAGANNRSFETDITFQP